MEVFELSVGNKINLRPISPYPENTESLNSQGDLYYDDADNRLKIHNGTNFSSVVSNTELDQTYYLMEDTSRTIYVSSSGDDVNGDGTINLPYLTIGKALSIVSKTINAGVTVTISVGVGTFTISASDLAVLSTLSGAGTLEIVGTLVLVDAGFTMGSAEALDPLTYAVSGGNTASWTLNQWQFHFLKSGSNYYPITHNALTPTISVAGAVTGTEIYQAQTILNLPNLKNIVLNMSFEIKRCKVVLASPMQLMGFGGAIFFEDYFTSTFINSSIEWEIGMYGNLARNSFENIVFTKYARNKPMLNCYIKASSSSIGLVTTNGLDMNFGNVVFENTSTAATASCISHGTYGSQVYNAPTSYLKFVNSNTGIISSEPSFISHIINNLIFVNTNYFYRKPSGGSDYKREVTLRVNNFYGAPTIRWFFDPMYEFVNLSSGRNIQIAGLIYPEYEQNLSSALVDNTTTNIVIGNKLQNRSIIIDYTIIRGTTYEMGRLQIVHNGTTLSLSESTPVGDDVGISFATNFNTNEILLECTLTSTGTAATIKYNVTRVMITPLTI